MKLALQLGMANAVRTRAACVAHARREHTDKLIGPGDYCGTYYAHLADSMKHHVNECTGSTTSSDNTDD